MQQTSVRTVKYLRISADKLGDEHGVANQDEECDKLISAREMALVGRYCDNDISASSGRLRPEYQAMMTAAARREFDAILVWQTSRLWRNRVERAKAIEILRQAGISVIAVKGPSLDMSTAYGRGMAGMLGEFDTMESEVKGERQRLAAEAAARNGQRWTGCPRPFGYAGDHVTTDPDEAAAIEWAAHALIGGSTVSSVMREWNARELLAPQTGRPFTRQSVTTIMRNPRLAGLSAYCGEIIYGDDGEPVAGTWAPVLGRELWEAVRALLGDPARKPPRGVRTLLGGVARCRCGNVIIGGQNATGKSVYRCNPPTRGERQGPHGQQMTGPVDDHVTAVIIGVLAEHGADLVAPKRPDLAPLRAEAAAIRA